MRPGIHIVTIFSVLLCPLGCIGCAWGTPSEPPERQSAARVATCGCCHCHQEPPPAEPGDEPAEPESEPCMLGCVCKGAVVEHDDPFLDLADAIVTPVPEIVRPTTTSTHPEPSTHPPPIPGTDLRITLQSLTC